MPTVLLLVVGLLSGQTAASPDGPGTSDQPATTSAAVGQPPAVSDPSTDEASGAVTPGSERLVPVRPKRADAAADFLRDTLRQPAQGALTGTEVTLYQVLADPTGRAPRAELIRGYWQLSAAVADYHLALAAQNRLKQLAQSSPPPADTSVADQFKLALATAQVRVAATRLAAVRAQHQLAELRPDLTPTALPLPADPPHTGGYRTLYEQIFAGRLVPAARRLNATLPLAHTLTDARATAVKAADRLLASASSDLTSGRGTATDVLDCYRQLVEQQQQLITAIHDYNLAIAEYAQLVAPAGSDPTRLVTMLIKPRSDPARPLPATAASGPTAASRPETTSELPTTTGRMAVDSDGLISVLKRPPAAGTAAADNGQPGGDRAGSGVVQATATEPVDDGPTSPATTQPGRLDSLVPGRLERGP